MISAHDTDNVFINCLFDAAYKPLFDAMVFTVHDCGFIAWCALEEEAAGTRGTGGSRAGKRNPFKKK